MNLRGGAERVGGSLDARGQAIDKGHQKVATSSSAMNKTRLASADDASSYHANSPSNTRPHRPRRGDVLPDGVF